MRIAIAAAVTCLSIIGMTATAQVHAAIRQHTEIPPEPLDLALRTLAKERGFQLVYLTENVATLQTRGAIGDFTIDEALKKLLSDSHLEFKFVDDNTVSIFPKTSPSSALGKDRTRTSGGEEGGSERGSEQQFHMAQVAQGTSAGSSSINGTTPDPEDSGATRGLSEIVVTAQKKSERLQDVPVPVSVINTRELTNSGQVLLKDYYTSVPGFNASPNIEGSQMLSIRGVTTGGFSNPTVGIMIDDVPYGIQLGNAAPDIDPGELARIEVLRGPQGTLYGADAMGGVLKFVTIDPSSERFSGRIETGTSSVFNGAEPGFNIRGSVNVPITDTLAVRASAFRRQDAGYIDNPSLNLSGVNEMQVDGARVSALWHPSEVLSLKLSALYQHNKSDSLSEANTLGTLKQNTINGAEEFDNTLQAYSAVLKVRFGAAELTSVTGYNDFNSVAHFDYTPFLGSYTQCGDPGVGSNGQCLPPGTGFNGFGVTGTILNDFSDMGFPQFPGHRPKVAQRIFQMPLG